MRKIAILLLPLLLAACVNDAASFYINGADQALTLRRDQDYFWENATISLVVANLPACQRSDTLALAPAADVDIEVFASGEEQWTLRSGSVMWQVDTRDCTVNLGAPTGALGARAGVFTVRHRKLTFDAQASAAPAAAQ